MRVKKRKAQKKYGKFYATVFKFRPPYRFLVDGALLYRARDVDLKSQLAQLLDSSKIQIFISKCILTELRGLYAESIGTEEAKGLNQTVQMAIRLRKLDCTHGGEAMSAD